MTSLKIKKGTYNQISLARLFFMIFLPVSLIGNSSNIAGENTFSNAFITTWKTDNPGPSADNQITIPINILSNYDYNVDWGDGTSDTNVTTAITHTYASPGTYTVSITGEFPVIGFANLGSDNEKILTVEQWGDIQWSRIAFQGCVNLDVVATDTPDLTQVTTLSQAFTNCTSLVGNASFNDWDVSNVVSMGGAFRNTPLFNQPLGNWDTSKVRFMTGMFADCTSFNQDIGGWNVSNVEEIGGMFGGASSFNQDIGNWDVSSVRIMGGMFVEATAFNQDISGWNTSNVTDIRGMFIRATSFNQPIGNWDMSNVMMAFAMFQEASSFNQPIGNWDMSNVTSLKSMFFGATAFNQDIGNWDVSNVENMNFTFQNAVNFNQDIGNWNTGKVTEFGRMFKNASAFNQDIGNWDVTSAIRMVDMFFDATSFNQNLENWDVSGISRMENIFFNTAMSTENYDALLIGWSQLNLQNDVSFEIRPTQYCLGASARQSIIDTFNWEIRDGGSSCPFEAFVTTWKTDNPGTSQSNQVSIPTFPGESYNYSIDWGDGSSDTGVTGNITHTYASSGTYTISISGDFPRFYSNNQGDKEKLLTVESWGDIAWTSMDSAFEGCLNLDVVAQDTPDLSGVTTLFQMFDGCRNLVGNNSFNSWDVSNIVFFSSMFNRATLFNQNLDAWNLSSARRIDNLFSFSGFNGDINAWNVSGVTSMNFVFSGNPNFNQELGDWDVRNVTSMTGMFQNATSFNQNVGGWDVGSVRQFGAMFRGASVFDQNLSQWDTSLATDMSAMFKDAGSFNADIGSWNLTNVRSTARMFEGASAFNQNLNNWDVSSVTTMIDMFRNATLFNGIISNWDVSSVTNMQQMFLTAISFNQDISSWDVGAVTTMKSMFAGASSFDQALGSWNVSNVEDMSIMFFGVTLSIDNYDDLLIGWNAQNLQPNVNFDGGNSQFCLGAAARQNMINSFGWTITDGGPEQTAPTIVCPADVSVESEVSTGVVIDLESPTGSDNCSTELQFEGVRDDGLLLIDPFPIGETLISWKASDDAGNESNTCVQSVIVTFSPPPFSITAFFLVDSNTNEDLIPISDNSIIDISTLTTRDLDIRAVATDDTQRVRFRLTGAINKNRVDNSNPYLLFGNSGNQSLEVGNYTLTATAFFRGSNGTPRTINFQLIDNNQESGANSSSIILYPNPVTTELNIKIQDSDLKISRMEIYDINGNLVESRSLSKSKKKAHCMDVSSLKVGVYFVNLYSEHQMLARRRIIITD